MNEKNENQNNSTFTTQNLVMMALFAAVLCVSAYISIPLPNGSHITFLNFIITLIALLFPLSQSVMIIVVWLLLGIVGVPVFIAGNAGLGYLIGPLGGYSIAFLIVGILIPLFRGKKYNRIRYTIVSVISVILVDLIGMVWLKTLNGMTWKAAWIAGFFSFILLDIVKAVVAAQVVPAFQRIVKNRNI